MKKFLLSVLAIVTVGCQKDYYLDDLQDAEREIAQLESIRQSQQELIQDLQGNLEEANDQIVSLEHTVAEVNYENNLLNLNVDLLKFVVAQREFTIDSLLNVTAQQSATIAIHEETIRDLNDEITSLNNALTEANELATQQAARIVELENVPPVYITIVRTNTVYRDRNVPVYVTRGVTYSEGGSYASNLDVTDCAGAALARVVSGNLTFSIAPSNANNCEGDLGIEVIKEGQTDPILSNASHFAVTASTSSFTMGEVVTIRATGISSFTATVTIPTLPISQIASGTNQISYNIIYNSNYDSYTNRGYVAVANSTYSSVQTTNGSSFNVQMTVNPKHHKRWRYGNDMPQSRRLASNWLVKSSIEDVSLTVLSAADVSGSDKVLLTVQVDTPVNAPDSNDLTISVRDRVVVNSSDPANDFPGLFEDIPAFDLSSIFYEGYDSTWAHPFSDGTPNNSKSGVRSGQEIELDLVVFPSSGRNWRSTYTSTDFENINNWSADVELASTSISETSIEIISITHVENGTHSPSQKSGEFVRMRVRVTLGIWAHGGISNSTTLRVKIKDSVPNGGAGLFE